MMLLLLEILFLFARATLLQTWSATRRSGCNRLDKIPNCQTLRARLTQLGRLTVKVETILVWKERLLERIVKERLWAWRVV
jgi:hypothetical protein